MEPSAPPPYAYRKSSVNRPQPPLMASSTQTLASDAELRCAAKSALDNEGRAIDAGVSAMSTVSPKSSTAQKIEEISPDIGVTESRATLTDALQLGIYPEDVKESSAHIERRRSKSEAPPQTLVARSVKPAPWSWFKFGKSSGKSTPYSKSSANLAPPPQSSAMRAGDALSEESMAETVRKKPEQPQMVDIRVNGVSEWQSLLYLAPAGASAKLDASSGGMAPLRRAASAAGALASCDAPGGTATTLRALELDLVRQYAQTASTPPAAAAAAAAPPLDLHQQLMVQLEMQQQLILQQQKQLQELQQQQQLHQQQQQQKQGLAQCQQAAQAPRRGSTVRAVVFPPPTECELKIEREPLRGRGRQRRGRGGQAQAEAGLGELSLAPNEWHAVAVAAAPHSHLLRASATRFLVPETRVFSLRGAAVDARGFNAGVGRHFLIRVALVSGDNLILSFADAAAVRAWLPALLCVASK